MGLLWHRVERSEIAAGDHIYSWRAVFAYSHHGIYVGGNKVVHFTRKQSIGSTGDSSLSISSPISDPLVNIFASSSMVPSTCSTFPDCGFQQPYSGVVISCLDCFLAGGSLHRFEYGVTPSAFLVKVRGGTCTTAVSDPQEAVVHRAMYLLQNGFGNYDVFSNNCEDFSIYCKTGLLIVDKTAPGRSGQAACITSAQWAAFLSSSLKLLMSSPIGVVTATAGMYCLSRYAADIGVRSDVIKVPVEKMSLFHGWEDIHEEVAEENESGQGQNSIIRNDGPPAKRRRC